ncbi:hypothetical protein GFH48_03840 [Streptomyces fagopyri]|uniref:Uncharacterized protein n=1 Tax=Streptomyces fagopyri TaxID=2662397 RepID=A0A5Q0L6L1_9ACTN|nr:hypothetical protein [Streptomyces fagopyri]QFZ72508.1 hypothetical protein GFH48_03840 [Streptomyces fagopyri]
MVHTHDARLALGAARPPPDEGALDGVDEFPSTCCSGTAARPYEPAAVDHHATEGSSWRPSLSSDGTWTTRPAHAARHHGRRLPPGHGRRAGPALHGRIPVDSLKGDGDGHLFDLFLARDPYG